MSRDEDDDMRGLARIKHSSRLGALAWLAFCLLGATANLSAREEPFNAVETIRGTVAIIERDHLSQPAINDEVSRKWLRKFLDQLDPNRLYFLKADVEKFQESRKQLDEFAREGRFDFPQRVRSRYRQRVNEAKAIAEDFIVAKHDYTVDEEIPIRFNGYAADRDELSERWRLSMKFELLIEKRHGRPRSEVEDHLIGRYRRIARQADEMSDERLCEIYLNALAAVCDPHSGYLSPSVIQLFSSHITIRTYGLGIGLRQRVGRFVITVLHPTLRDNRFSRRMVGWQLIAFRRLNGQLTDLVEIDPRDVSRMTMMPYDQLEQDTEILLELMHPVTYERVTMSWPRFQNR